MTLRTLAVLLCIGAGAALAVASVREDPARPLRVAVADRGPIVAAVSATGSVNPRRTVDVSSQLSGQVREVLVDYNSLVEANQPVARLEDSHLVARLGAAIAEEQAARANLTLAESQRTRAGAQIAAAQARHERALAAARAEAAGSVAEAGEAEALAVAAAADLEVAEAQVRAAVATVEQRIAQRRQIEVDIERSVIRSPIAGVVVNRQVNVGQTVAASLAAPTLFLIAGDLAEMELWATVDEADIGRVREGQTVRFSVGAWPEQTFIGHVRTVRLAATVTQNVVTYTVVVAVRNDDGRLMPGMTATMRIETDRRDDALRVPSAALRFRPSGAVVSLTDAGTGTVYVQGEGGHLTPVAVRTGISDARFTEIVPVENEAIAPGTPVVIGVMAEGPARRSTGIRLGF